MDTRQEEKGWSPSLRHGFLKNEQKVGHGSSSRSKQGYVPALDPHRRKFFSRGMAFESEKSTRQRQSSISSSSSTFKTWGVSGKWEMEKDWVNRERRGPKAKLGKMGCEEGGNGHNRRQN